MIVSMRRAAITVGAAAAVAVGLAVAASVASRDGGAADATAPATTAAAGFTRGPYLTRVGVTDARLRWVAAPGAGAVTVIATAPDGASVTARDGALTGLRPGTRHTWTARTASGATAAGTLTTAPARGLPAMTFVSFGDYGAATPEERAVGLLAARQKPRLLLTTGDNSYLVALEGLLDRNIFTPLREAMAVAPQYGVVGDHDVVVPGGRAALVDAMEWPGGGERYVRDYGPVRVVALGLRADRADVAFAARALAAPGPRVRFVIVHQPPKAGNPVMPVLARHPPDAVLSGHLHAYERRTRPEVPGTPFLTVGTGGAPASGRTPRSADARVYLLTAGLLRIDVGPHGIVYRFLDTDGRTRDRTARPLRTP